jgi:hypothetical protein
LKGETSHWFIARVRLRPETALPPAQPPCTGSPPSAP